MSFPPSANREMGAGTNETGRSPCCSFAAQTLTKGRTSGFHAGSPSQRVYDSSSLMPSCRKKSGDSVYDSTKSAPSSLGSLSVAFTFGMKAVADGLSPLEALLISMTNVTSHRH